MYGELRKDRLMLTLLQTIDGSAKRCQTCLFPTYPHINAIDVAAYNHIDFSNQWVYFLGDVTVHQMYGEFSAILHRAPVGSIVLLSTTLTMS